MFESIPMAPPDPILGLTDAFKKDPNPNKINLGVGIYVDQTGKPPTFDAVRKAEEIIFAENAPKAYLPISGSTKYGALVAELALGVDHPALTEGRVHAAQTPGGTGACRVAGDFLKTFLASKRIWVSSPTWDNHPKIFAAAGLEVATYPYYDAAARAIDIDAMIAGIKSIPEGEAILLHGSCHNPTGMDPTAEQWERIAQAIASRRLFPFVDFAYQGFGQGLEEDAAGVRLLCHHLPEVLVATSYSKNFGLYNERVGGLLVVGPTDEASQKAFSQVKSAIRANYSNPPSHGGAIVATILSDPALRTQWLGQLDSIRGRIQGMRRLFAQKMAEHGSKIDYSFIMGQNGMFSLSGLSREQVEQLRDQYAIYLVGSGRLNVAGMNEATMDRLCEALVAVQ